MNVTERQSMIIKDKYLVKIIVIKMTHDE